MVIGKKVPFALSTVPLRGIDAKTIPSEKYMVCPSQMYVKTRELGGSR